MAHKAQINVAYLSDAEEEYPETERYTPLDDYCTYTVHSGLHQSHMKEIYSIYNLFPPE